MTQSLPSQPQGGNPMLAQMQDIQLPPDIGLWPLATGWYLLMLLSLLLCLALAWFIRKRQRHLAPQKIALRELTQLNSQTPELAWQVSTLLKRVALHYGPRDKIAALGGDAWSALLDEALPPGDAGFAVLLGSRYTPQTLSPEQAQTLLSLAELWLKQAPRWLAGRFPC
ncbi:DUF4381 domain-containing protein [Shewanella sedimentimangrovi]|uniref:DUF4381 domain-containing protein n=1 Tax=Shewanella sedimentimangrovi TaxID=2814293 RepID=A0ABX7QXJ5_9GAMM|nr:DUF4381 domain-containing protein [Shewanella sedimentimangrovi]QSX35959.1 DUF4381 domain-containing protein [Shewanella sedimentimangrovi]